SEELPRQPNGRRPGRITTRSARCLLEADAFARLVLVERRRSERSGRAFGILVLRAAGSLEPRGSTMGRAICDTVDETTREIDVAGWITPHSALGVLLPDLPAVSPGAALEAARARIRQALDRHQVPGIEVTIAARQFPEPTPPDTEAATPGPTRTLEAGLDDLVEPLLYPELS